ncbi:hypothetical protein PGB90_003486 [Kerria lacca]
MPRIQHRSPSSRGSIVLASNLTVKLLVGLHNLGRGNNLQKKEKIVEREKV